MKGSVSKYATFTSCSLSRQSEEARAHKFTLLASLRSFADGEVDGKAKDRRNNCALAIYFFWYNWTRIHKTLGVSPAMAAGLTDKLLSMSDLAEIISVKIDHQRDPHGKPKD